jgi:hypothetical protein
MVNESAIVLPALKRYLTKIRFDGASRLSEMLLHRKAIFADAWSFVIWGLPVIVIRAWGE